MVAFPEYAFQFGEPCTRSLVSRMLRNRGYRLEVTSYKKDKGLHKVYMFDAWADPMLFKIGEYRDGEKPDWAAMYDAAMARHVVARKI